MARLKLTSEEFQKLTGSKPKEATAEGDGPSDVQREPRIVYCKCRGVVVYQWCEKCGRQLCGVCYLTDPCRKIDPAPAGVAEEK